MTRSFALAAIFATKACSARLLSSLAAPRGAAGPCAIFWERRTTRVNGSCESRMCMCSKKLKSRTVAGPYWWPLSLGAFLKVYRSRTLDLYRIASEGTGILREGEIHPDLANRLAAEASECARRTLRMCIRAIDYCPPVGITFGDYLRAIVTAGADGDPEDEYGFRLAFTESFRQWGISPADLRSMSVESLLWPTGEAAAEEANVQMDRDAFASDVASLINEEQAVTLDFEAKSMRRSKSIDRRLKRWNLTSDRYKTWQAVDHNSAILHAWLVNGPAKKWLVLLVWTWVRT